MYRKSILFALLLPCLLLVTTILHGKECNVPNVVVSIKPFYNLAAAVMKDVGKPTLLIKSNASPHDYVLKPSEARSIYESDLLIWGGANLEIFLNKVLMNTEKKQKCLMLNSLDGLLLLPNRNDTNWSDHLNLDQAHHGHHDDTFDPHIWLLPDNAIIIVRAICAALSEINPENQITYKKNCDEFVDTLKQLTCLMRRKLLPFSKQPVLVFHDAYQYFEHAFPVNIVGAITLNPDIPPSAKKVRQVKRILNNKQVVCIFKEPQFKPKIVDMILQGTTLRQGTLDPLGKDKHVGPEGYFQLMTSLVNSFELCLKF